MNEFRENNSITPSHTAHIYGRQGNKFLHMNITHSPISKRGKEYIEMKKDPNNNPKSCDFGKKSYFNPEARKSDMKFFGKVKEGWKLCNEDDEMMKSFRLSEFDDKGRQKNKKSGCA